MLISTKEFDRLAFKMMLNIQRGNYYPETFDFSISYSDYCNLLDEMIDHGFVEGFVSVLDGFKAMAPRITRGGMQMIEMFIFNNVLNELVRRVTSQGLKNSSITKSEVEQRLGVETKYFIFYLESLEHNGLIEITSKLHADDELYNYEVKLTPAGYNEYSGSSLFVENEQAPVVHVNHGVQNTFSNSTVVQGNISISDSFNQSINMTDLSDDQKKELTDLIKVLLEEKHVSLESESKIKKFFSKMAGKASETVVTQSVIALIKSLLG